MNRRVFGGFARLRPQEDGAPAGAEVFRPHAILRYLVLGADYFWLLILLALVMVRGASDAAFFGAAFFIALFTVCGLFYWFTAIVVTPDGITYRGMVAQRAIAFDDILRVQARPGLVGTDYDVLTRRGFVQFSSVFHGHKRLFEIIVARARLHAC